MSTIVTAALVVDEGRGRLVRGDRRAARRCRCRLGQRSALHHLVHETQEYPECQYADKQHQADLDVRGVVHGAWGGGGVWGCALLALLLEESDAPRAFIFYAAQKMNARGLSLSPPSAPHLPPQSNLPRPPPLPRTHARTMMSSSVDSAAPSTAYYIIVEHCPYRTPPRHIQVLGATTDVEYGRSVALERARDDACLHHGTQVVDKCRGPPREGCEDVIYQFTAEGGPDPAINSYMVVRVSEEECGNLCLSQKLNSAMLRPRVARKSFDFSDELAASGNGGGGGNGSGAAAPRA